MGTLPITQVLADTPERQERQERPRLENQQTDAGKPQERPTDDPDTTFVVTFVNQMPIPMDSRNGKLPTRLRNGKSPTK